MVLIFSPRLLKLSITETNKLALEYLFLPLLQVSIDVFK